ncbi:hypothetical protein [Streptomyces arenae]|uniref:hypothetical protein n=1 Tax=Streptomyces arenae TaxID=29301 RepID=UPI002658C6D4|nr:hypothetical protein [Streptomyces arenae]MCG7210380.1 hypothetical protein [Streptomyces arenae]
MIFIAPQASAANTFCVYTTDAFKGGQACWTPNGDKLEGCDIEADGLRPSLTMTYAGGSMSFDVYGGNGKCRTEVNDLREGTPVTVKVCLQKGDTGREVYCNSGRGTA